MKKILILAILLITLISCKKQDSYCYECQEHITIYEVRSNSYIKDTIKYCDFCETYKESADEHVQEYLEATTFTTDYGLTIVKRVGSCKEVK